MFKDVSDIKKYANTPVMVKLKEKKNVDQSKKLFDMLAKELTVKRGKIPTVDYHQPFQTTEDLIEEGLIKIVEIEADVKPDTPKEEITLSTIIRSKISVNEAKSAMTDEEANEIRELLTENTIDNGGTLEYATLTRDVYVSVESDGEILGQVGLVSHGDGRLYVGVTAVKKEYQGLGVGSKMYDFIKQHSSQFSILTADVRNFNIASKKLHFSHGFKIIDDYGDILDPNELIYNEFVIPNLQDVNISLDG